MEIKRFRGHLIALILVVVTTTVFWQVLDHGFVGEWDDKVNIKENPNLNPVTLPKVLHFWQQQYKGLYIPLTYTVWAGVAKVSQMAQDGARKLSPRPFHLANLVLHLLSVLVVFAILKMLLQRDWAAGVGALLFALHPIQVESVAWITGMKDVLSGFLSLVAVWQYLSYAASRQALERQNHAWSRIQWNGHYAAASVAFVLALLAKPAAVIVPVVNWLIDYWMLRRPLRQSALALVPWMVVAVPFIFITKLAQPDDGFTLSLWARPLVAADAVMFYLYRLILPVWFSPDYGRLPQLVLQHWWTYLVWIIPCALAYLGWLTRDKKPWLGASVGVFVVGILPVSGLIPFDFQAISTVADRYLYFSMLGAALGLAGLVAQLEKRAFVAWVCVLMLSLLAVASMLQIRYWRDTTTLFNHALTINPNSWIAHNNLGNVRAAGGDLEQALEHFRQSLLANPLYGETHNNLGSVFAMTGELDKAMESYQRAVEISPGLAEPYNNLGLVLVKRGGLDEAIKHYRQALKIDPMYADAYNNLGNALAERGEIREAIEQFRRAIEIAPDFALAYYNLGNALVRGGQLQEAIQHFQQALRIEPAFAGTHNNLGAALLAQGESEEALRHFREVIRLTPARSESYLNLGSALLNQGQLDEAIVQFREVLRIEPDFAEAHENLGRALALQGRKEDAVKHYQEAVRILKSRGKASDPR